MGLLKFMILISAATGTRGAGCGKYFNQVLGTIWKDGKQFSELVVNLVNISPSHPMKYIKTSSENPQSADMPPQFILYHIRCLQVGSGVSVAYSHPEVMVNSVFFLEMGK